MNITQLKKNNIKILNEGTFMDLIEKDYDCELFYSVLIEQDYNHQIIIDDLIFYIPQLNIAVANAIFNEYDNDEKEYYADWAGTAVFNITSNGFEYYMIEQDDFLITLHNMNIRNVAEQETYALTNIENIIDCTII